MTQSSNLKKAMESGWRHGSAFLPLVILPLAKLSLVSQRGLFVIAVLFAVLVVPLVQLLSGCLIFTYSHGEISRYRKGIWFVNVAVCWMVVWADPGGWLHQLADMLD